MSGSAHCADPVPNSLQCPDGVLLGAKVLDPPQQLRPYANHLHACLPTTELRRIRRKPARARKSRGHQGDEVWNASWQICLITGPKKKILRGEPREARRRDAQLPKPRVAGLAMMTPDLSDVAQGTVSDRLCTPRDQVGDRDYRVLRRWGNGSSGECGCRT